jgi:hypothetical protein
MISGQGYRVSDFIDDRMSRFIRGLTGKHHMNHRLSIEMPTGLQHRVYSITSVWI